MADDTMVLEPAAEVAEPLETSIPDLETTDAAESTTAAETTTETTEDKTEEKAEDKTIPVNDAAAVAAVSPKDMNAHLQAIKEENPVLAKALHAKLTDGFRLAGLLKEAGAKDITELKAKLSAGDTEFRQSIEETDELLYNADPELAKNVFDDMKSEGKEDLYGKVVGNFVEHLREADPQQYVGMQRSMFLGSCEESGLIEALDGISKAVYGDDIDSAKALLKNVVKFFTDEIKNDGEVSRVKSTAVTESNKAVTALRNEIFSDSTKTMNTVLGGFLGELLRTPLKGLTRSQQEELAVEIKKTALSELGKDSDYVKDMETRFNKAKTKEHKDALLKTYSDKLKSGFGKKVVTDVARKLYPTLMQPKPAVVVPKAPPTINVRLDGKDVKAFVFAKRPGNLIRNDVFYNGRLYETKDLEMLQISKQQGFVKSSKSDKPLLVSWKVSS